MSNSELYEKDFAAWAEQTAEALRQRRFSEIDVRAVAEEIEDMGRNDKRELKNRLRLLLAHLLKFHLQPEKRSPSWRSTILVQRGDIQTLLEKSPSLKRLLQPAAVYRSAVELAAAETGLAGEGAFPLECPYTAAQILDSRFWPGEEAP